MCTFTIHSSGLVFTSQTAVDASMQTLAQSGDEWRERLTKQWKDLPVFVVGKATSQAGTDEMVCIYQ